MLNPEVKSQWLRSELGPHRWRNPCETWNWFRNWSIIWKLIFELGPCLERPPKRWQKNGCKLEVAKDRIAQAVKLWMHPTTWLTHIYIYIYLYNVAHPIVFYNICADHFYSWTILRWTLLGSRLFVVEGQKCLSRTGLSHPKTIKHKLPGKEHERTNWDSDPQGSNKPIGHQHHRWKERCGIGNWKTPKQQKHFVHHMFIDDFVMQPFLGFSPARQMETKSKQETFVQMVCCQRWKFCSFQKLIWFHLFPQPVFSPKSCPCTSICAPQKIDIYIHILYMFIVLTYNYNTLRPKSAQPKSGSLLGCLLFAHSAATRRAALTKCIAHQHKIVIAISSTPKTLDAKQDLEQQEQEIM